MQLHISLTARAWVQALRRQKDTGAFAGMLQTSQAELYCITAIA